MTGCDKEFTEFGAGNEATMSRFITRYCILTKDHDGACIWSAVRESNWSYQGRFEMEVTKMLKENKK